MFVQSKQLQYFLQEWAEKIRQSMPKKQKQIRKPRKKTNKSQHPSPQEQKSAEVIDNDNYGQDDITHYRIENNKVEGFQPKEDNMKGNASENSDRNADKNDGKIIANRGIQKDDQDLSEFKIIKPLYMDLKQVASLEPQVRSKLKQQHGHLAEYIFMTQRQKCKYFHEKNHKYNSIMEKGGSMPARKISFKRNFEVKCFKKEEEPATVGKSKSYRDKYNDKIHYS